MHTGENSIIEARIFYPSNSYKYIVLLFAVKYKFLWRYGWIQQLIPLIYLDSI